MRFPVNFTRWVGSIPAGGVQLGTDVLLVDGSGAPRKPEVGVDANFLSTRNISMNGTPTNRVALIAQYTGGGAPVPLYVSIYVFEDNLAMYLPVLAAAGVTVGIITPGTAAAPGLPTFFDALTLIDQPAVGTTIQYPQPGGSTFLCLVSNSGSDGAAPNGRYDFILASDLSAGPNFSKPKP